MLGRMRRSIKGSYLAQFGLFHAWRIVSWMFRSILVCILLSIPLESCPGYEHCSPKNSSRWSFPGWHNPKIYNHCLNDRDSFYVFADITEWSEVGTNCIVHSTSPPVYEYYRNRVHGVHLRLFVLTISKTKFAVCTSIQLMSAALVGNFDTFSYNTPLVP